jgi:hypothetical protein
MKIKLCDILDPQSMESLLMPCHTEKTKGWSHFSLPAGSKAACMKLQNEQVSITHHMKLPYPLAGKIIQHSLWQTEPPSAKLKNINSEM